MTNLLCFDYTEYYQQLLYIYTSRDGMVTLRDIMLFKEQEKLAWWNNDFRINLRIN